MRTKNSGRSIVLQPPVGFHTTLSEGAITLSDGALLRPDSRGLYHLDSAHRHLLPSFVAQGWHAPRPELRISELEVDGNAQPPLSTVAILDLAHSERVALRVQDGRLLMRGQPSPRLRLHLRRASVALSDELMRRDRSAWIEI
jgi:hypothetical protein